MSSLLSEADPQLLALPSDFQEMQTSRHRLLASPSETDIRLANSRLEPADLLSRLPRLPGVGTGRRFPEIDPSLAEMAATEAAACRVACHGVRQLPSLTPTICVGGGCMAEHDIIDIAGQRFGRLVAISQNGRRNGCVAWLCRCDCGNEKTINGHMLRSGDCKSCGCLRREVSAATSPRTKHSIEPGARFGRLTVLGAAPKKGTNHSRWHCRCDCGEERDVKGFSLVLGKTVSCGCLSGEMLGDRTRTHGMTGTALYRIWNGIKRRCQTPANKDYPRYGGRGIKLCERWQDFANFHADIPERPSKRHTLDRRDNDGHYEPGNVFWATPQEQQNNMRSNRQITYRGRTMNATQWAIEIGVKPRTFFMRLSKGMTPEEAIEYQRCDPFYVEARQFLTKLQRAKMFAEHLGVCVVCKTKIDGAREKWIDEHIVPLSRGGSNDMSNRGPAHERCAIEKTKDDKTALAKDRRVYAARIGAQGKRRWPPMPGTKVSAAGDHIAAVREATRRAKANG